MAIDHGVLVDFQDAPLPPAPVSETVIGVVGTGSAGSPTSTLGVPSLVGSLDASETVFGTAGTLADFFTNFYSLASGFVVGVRYDGTLTGSALTDAITEAIEALRTGEAVTGQKPTILLAPGTTYLSTDGGLANANTTLLATIAAELDAIAIADAAYSDIADTVTYAGNNGADRLWIIGQTVETGSVAALNGSSYAAAAIARNDSENGAADSISNRALIGITSVTPSLSFSYRLAGTQAGQFDAVDVGSFVRHRGRFRVWGFRCTYATLTDARRFLNIQRVIDTVETAAVNIAQDMVDRGVTSDFPGNLAANIQAYLDGLVATGALIAGAAESDRAANTPTSLAAGRVTIILTIQPVAVAELVSLTVQLLGPGA